ncbi:hypothetical protein COOONC_09755 [Cooperia oncophora]
MACDASLPPPSPSSDPLASAQQRIAELSLKPIVRLPLTPGSARQRIPLTSSSFRILIIVPGSCLIPPPSCSQCPYRCIAPILSATLPPLPFVRSFVIPFPIPLTFLVHEPRRTWRLTFGGGGM